MTSFACGGAFPVCQASDAGPGVCSEAPACAEDDDHESGDDNPLTAKLALVSGVPVAGKICGLPGERDFFPLTLTSTGDVVLTIQSADPRVFLALSDGSGRLLALSVHGQPRTLHARSLAAGTYYAAVGAAADDGDGSASSYTIERTGGGVPCTSDAFCSAVTPTEIYRGNCDVPTGACTFIEGKRALPPLAPCDDDTDCKSGVCSGYPFAGDPQGRSRCSVLRDGPSGAGQVPSSELCEEAGLDFWVCTTFELVNRCLPRCKTDDDCPLVDLLAPPAGGQPWLHMSCTATGRCEHYD